MKRLNKKGDKLISIYWFAILVIVATGVVIMVNVFYGSQYDVREIEAGILSQKVADCIYPGGKMNPLLVTPQGAFREDFKDRFMERCSLNFDTGDELKRPQYYLEVNFYKEGNLKKNVFSLVEGNLNFKEDCKIDLEEEKLANCVNKEFFAISPSEEIYLIIFGRL